MQLIAIKQSLAITIIASHLEGQPFENARQQFRTILESLR